MVQAMVLSYFDSFFIYWKYFTHGYGKHISVQSHSKVGVKQEQFNSSFHLCFHINVFGIL